MLKLSGLMLATLAGLFAVLITFGREDLRSERRPVAAAPQNTAVSAGDPSLIAPTDPAPAPEPTPDPAATTPLPTPQQTPEQAPRFPGPALQASPEFADRAPTVPSDDPAADPDDTAPTAEAQLWVTASRLNMRSAPDSGASVVTGLDGGTALEALGPLDAAWVHVRAPGGQTGYVSGQFVSDQPQ